ncbi:hypothetical protein ON010_g17030 [Phytophthora cinnamomi]|nr:hypothetical protein ON010_g17030 [Phytophthora cinnamomi]
MYRQQSICAVAASRRQKLLARRAKDPRPHEILHVVALLFEMAVAPIRAGLAKHWSTEEEGAIPRGTFSRFMKRARFEAIMKFQHFNNNEEGSAQTDKAWKVRPILQVVKKTFRRGYRLGKVISFDEGMMPNRTKYNPMRVFMPDKPSKYGIKFFMTCCAETAYCSSYKEKKKTAGDTLGMAGKAVVRKISKALSGQVMKRLIVTDSYYSFTALSLKLLGMGLYHVGTARIDHLGWCPLHFTQAKRHQRMPRGTYRIAHARNHPEMIALSWMGSKPVNMLATGCSTRMIGVQRKEKDGTRTTVPCPQLVVDDCLGMGGVDIHDQLRLHRYSIQKCISLRKYYKQLFLCIVDMAVVNGYMITFVACTGTYCAHTSPAALVSEHGGLLLRRTPRTNADTTCVKCARPSPTPRPSRLRPATTAPNAATHSEGACPFVETFSVLREATHSRARKSGTRLGATARASREA